MYNRKDRDVHERKEDGQSEFEALNGTNAIMSDNITCTPHTPSRGDAAYLCHRSCQAWDFSRLIKLYRQAGYAVIVVGDLNSRPGSLPHKFLTQEAGLVDSWEQLHGKQDLAVIARLSPLQQLLKGCTTCDSLLNTWRAQRQPDEACRLDYALIDPDFLQTVDAGVRFTERIPHLDCSVSDHFAYSCTLNIVPQGTESRPSTSVKRAKTHDRD
ncbi:CEL_1a_G0014680.mRNA.1.CDS.1 [Saccharomyces cerevisiae]|nr:CEL_1a_G0014680.mRNA.1.CDS.1 [Saccharomyces cerevisiae]CAI7256270.1 CEL_1a_G0014680.mRNA.1.CDS.1 [Saccharomyces cerevisiae]